jgi:hypothetical protein
VVLDGDIVSPEEADGRDVGGADVADAADDVALELSSAVDFSVVADGFGCVVGGS